MVKNFKTMIRLSEWDVDEKRRKLGELTRLLDNLKAQEKALVEELECEQKAAAENPSEAGFLYHEYAKTVIERRNKIEQSIRQMDAAIAHARDELHDAFTALKKYEIAQLHRNDEAMQVQRRRDNNTLDEIGSQSHGRRQLA